MNMRSSHDNLKPKEGERAKAGELNASKGWFDNFRKRFGFRNVKIHTELTQDKVTGGDLSTEPFQATKKKNVE